MSDLIDRQALLKQIDIDSDGEPGYYGDTWKFIDTIKSMPPATQLSTNLAEVGTDAVSRKAVKELAYSQIRSMYCGVALKEQRETMLRIADNVIGLLAPVTSAQPATSCSEIPNGSDDTISRQAAIDATKKHYRAHDNDLLELIAFDIEQLPSVQPETEWNNHTVACLLAELFGDDCACNYNGIDEWLPEKCEVIDACPNPVGVACWEQFLKHRVGRRTDG